MGCISITEHRLRLRPHHFSISHPDTNTLPANTLTKLTTILQVSLFVSPCVPFYSKRRNKVRVPSQACKTALRLPTPYLPTWQIFLLLDPDSYPIKPSTDFTSSHYATHLINVLFAYCPVFSTLVTAKICTYKGQW